MHIINEQAMKILEKVIPLIPIMLFFWWLLTTYWFTCWYYGHNCDFFAAEPKFDSLVIVYKTDTIVQAEAISYVLSNPIAHSSNNLTKTLDILANFLKQRPDTKLIITGKHNSEKETAPSYIQLGLFRAEKLRDSLVARGTTHHQVEVIGESRDLQIYQDTVRQVIDFKVVSKLSTVDPALQDFFSKKEEIDLLLDVSNHSLHPLVREEEKMIYLEQLRIHLEQYPDKKVYIYLDKTQDNSRKISLNYFTSMGFRTETIEIRNFDEFPERNFQFPVIIK